VDRFEEPRQQLYNSIRGKSAVSPDMPYGLNVRRWCGPFARIQSTYEIAQARKEQGRITILRFADHRMGVPSPHNSWASGRSRDLALA
jgi:hypothetical protein